VALSIDHWMITKKNTWNIFYYTIVCQSIFQIQLWEYISSLLEIYNEGGVKNSKFILIYVYIWMI